ncbi:unnamed protein product [Closterium sp. NIES-64]|nr:unnamed protein product [Closterium sp. NIES-64]
MVASTTFQDRPLLLAAALLTLLLRIVHCLHPDVMALLAFKSVMGATFLTSWDPATSHCSAWEGIHCDQDNRVSWFTLSPCWGQWPPTPTMQGSFDASTSLGDLTEVTPIDLSALVAPGISCNRLRYIDLGFNDLTGLIPTAFQALTNLDAFYTPHNRLSGPAVGAFASRGDHDTRFFLDLSYNRLSTDNLRPFATLFNFMDVNLSHNELRGSVPRRMFQNASTLVLEMSYNNLQGGLDEFMALTGLCSLILAGNHLCGKIPAKISDLSRVQRLVLAWNALSGSMPEAFSFGLAFTNIAFGTKYPPFVLGMATAVCTCQVWVGLHEDQR